MAIFLLWTLRSSAFAFVNSVFGRCGKVPLDRSCWVLRLLAPVSLCIWRWIPIKIVFFTDFFVYSSEFCEAHLQLLFTILEKAPQATIRANTIVAVGDLTFRFPNLIEPWTSHLYARFVNGELQTYKVLESVLGVSKETHGSLWESNGQSISLPLSPFSLFLQQACRCTNTNLIKDIIDHVISFQRM